jgi:hypothetical protein
MLLAASDARHALSVSTFEPLPGHRRSLTFFDTAPAHLTGPAARASALRAELARAAVPQPLP